MKLILSLLAAATTLGFAIPTTASADHGRCETRRIVSYLPCGRPVFARYEVCGHDRLGRPVGHWETERANCDCPVCHPRPVVRPSCAPAPFDHRHSHGGRVEIGVPGMVFSFGRR